MTSVTEARILDLLADACARYRHEGERGAQWTLCTMSSDERVAFDLFLVRTKDPLAWQAGTMSYRFITRVRRMVDAQMLAATRTQLATILGARCLCGGHVEGGEPC